MSLPAFTLTPSSVRSLLTDLLQAEQDGTPLTPSLDAADPSACHSFANLSFLEESLNPNPVEPECAQYLSWPLPPSLSLCPSPSPSPGDLDLLHALADIELSAPVPLFLPLSPSTGDLDIANAPATSQCPVIISPFSPMPPDHTVRPASPVRQVVGKRMRSEEHQLPDVPQSPEKRARRGLFRRTRCARFDSPTPGTPLRMRVRGCVASAHASYVGWGRMPSPHRE